MAMASLSSSLLARKGQARPAVPASELPRQGTEILMYPVFAKQKPALLHNQTPSREKQKPVETTPARAQKTLRLNKKVDADLRRVAKQKKMTQQALMEQAVMNWLSQNQHD